MTKLDLPNKAELAEGSRLLSGKGESEANVKISRSFLGWVVIVSLAVLIFVIFHDKGGSKNGAPAEREPLPERSVWVAISGWSVVIGFAAMVGSVAAVSVLRRARGGSGDSQLGIERTGLTEEGIVMEGRGVRIVKRWESYRGFLESPTMFVLLMDDNKGEIILKKNLLPEEQSRLRGVFRVCVWRKKGELL